MDTVTAMIVGGAAAAVVLLALGLARKPVKCPTCGQEQPKFRKPTSADQAMWGGYTCKGCGAEMDARGQLKPARKG